jgi:hypothetical protein
LTASACHCPSPCAFKVEIGTGVIGVDIARTGITRILGFYRAFNLTGGAIGFLQHNHRMLEELEFKTDELHKTVIKKD